MSQKINFLVWYVKKKISLEPFLFLKRWYQWPDGVKKTFGRLFVWSGHVVTFFGWLLSLVGYFLWLYFCMVNQVGWSGSCLPV
jgi:hypothetical protein